jgi:two-component system nitrogen regulation sensor histidine kinase NtrY
MPRRPSFRDNTRLVLLATGAALLVLVGSEVFLHKSQAFSPDFLASVLLYGLTVSNLTLLLILLFVLGRNLVRVLMERRRKALGARFRLRLMLVFVLMAVAPSVLLLLVGSDLIRETVDRWFNVDVERIVSSSQALGTALRLSASDRSRIDAKALAEELRARRLLEPAGERSLRRTI